MPPKKSAAGRKAAAKAAPAPPKPLVSDALKNAIDTMPESNLRTSIKLYCNTMPDLRAALEHQFLIQGRDIVRYHADTDSEDAEDDSPSSEEDEDSEEEGSSPKHTKVKPITTADDEWAPRMAKCLNCKEDFDVTNNGRGDCIWHPGEKEVDYEGDYWADHDPNCHGDPSDFADDSDMAEGFTWNCCDESGDNEGCKSTKHKAAINMIVKPPPVVAPQRGQKRKAEELVSKKRVIARR